MSTASSSVHTKTPVKPVAKSTAGLRRLRAACVAVVVVSAVLLPFEAGTAHLPKLTSLPLIGQYFVAKPHKPPPPPPPPAIVAVQNSPRTAVVGHTERFWVHLANLPHALLTYDLRYPTGAVERATVNADGRGFSSHTFAVTYYPRHWREVATIGVRDASGRLHAFLRFAVQQPGK